MQTGARSILATGCKDGKIRLYSLLTDLALVFERQTPAPVLLLVWSPLGNCVVSAGPEGSNAQIWSYEEHTLKPMATLKQDGRINCAVFAGACIVTGSTGGTMHVWDAQTFECIRLLNAHTGMLTKLTVYSDVIVASASSDGHCRIWDITTGQCLHDVDWESGPVTDCLLLEMSNSMTYLVTCHVNQQRHEGRSLIWDTFTKKRGWIDGALRFPCTTIDGFRGRIVSCCGGFCEGLNCYILAFTCTDGSIKVYEVLKNCSAIILFSLDLSPAVMGHSMVFGWQASAALQSINGHNVAALSNKGNYLAAIDSKHTIHIVSIEDGESVKEIDDHRARVRSLFWISEDSLESSGEDGLTLISNILL